MIRMTKAQKKYGDFQLNCSLDVPAGSITGLIGGNGSGKSTTFKLLLGLISAEGGEIKILGKNPNKLSANDREKIGVVMTDTGFSDYLNVKEIRQILKSLYSTFDEELFNSLCIRFDLPEEKKILDFSTGMKAKLKTIVAVTHDANLLILDEVTAGLDVIVRNEILDLLREYMEKNEERNILISSHISSDLENLCDDIYMIKNGEIVFYEEVDELLGQYAVLKLSEEQYAQIEKEYILFYKKEPYGYLCLTNQKQYYLDNYPDVVIEKSTIDELMIVINRGEES
ncbi:ABC transporter ATP-binding protein [Vagococcus elongatus]|uniref:ABC transporter ATP-binding protein n=1 Tax=Vagococcus elongatus TaxID=180344 RepID=A0A430B1V7_9ENTE|nr:ABC transporter ATP-binding protein [Vagococcus elongatus]RSU14306.1 ABC transporter ATP-binding protein [Vagococcus elongatus]